MPIHFSLIEPDRTSVKTLRDYADSNKASSAGLFSASIYRSGWEEFVPSTYDFITATHVIYHFPLDKTELAANE